MCIDMVTVCFDNKILSVGVSPLMTAGCEMKVDIKQNNAVLTHLKTFAPSEQLVLSCKVACLEMFYGYLCIAGLTPSELFCLCLEQTSYKVSKPQPFLWYVFEKFSNSPLFGLFQTILLVKNTLRSYYAI